MLSKDPEPEDCNPAKVTGKSGRKGFYTLCRQKDPKLRKHQECLQLPMFPDARRKKPIASNRDAKMGSTSTEACYLTPHLAVEIALRLTLNLNL